LATVVLWEVLATVLFAVTVAYVPVPLCNRLTDRSLSTRLASALVSSGAFGVVLAVVGAFGFLLYRRRQAVIDLVGQLPDVFVVPVGGMEYAVELQRMITAGIAFVEAVATALAIALSVLSLTLFLFAILLFGLLLELDAAGRAAFRLVPESYHDVLLALHARVKQTLYGIPPGGDRLRDRAGRDRRFLDARLRRGVHAGDRRRHPPVRPVLGPSVLLALLAVIDLATRATIRAILAFVVGGVQVGAVPDAVVRPRLASRAADLPTGLYFIGFVGGVLTVGPVGFIAGPLVVELVDLPSESDRRSLSNAEREAVDAVSEGDDETDGET